MASLESGRSFLEEMFRPAAGCYSGVLAQSQNHQFRLWVVGVSCSFGFVQGLCRDDSTRARGFEVGHVTQSKSCATDGAGYRGSGFSRPIFCGAQVILSGGQCLLLLVLSSLLFVPA